MRNNGTSASSNTVLHENLARMPEESGRMLEEELQSAATPFIYLLSSLMITVSVYFVYTLLHG